MTKRRLAKLEGSLSPKQAVLHWLAEAHAFGSSEAYLRSVTEPAWAAHTIAGIATRLEASTTKTMRGRPRDAVARAVRDALREAAFLLHLVLQLDAAVGDLVRIEGLRLVAITLWLRELTLREELARHTDASGWRADAETLDRCWRDWRQATAGLVTTLATAEEARRALENRYLVGRDCLFPELADERRQLARRAEALAAIGASLGERGGAGWGPGCRRCRVDARKPTHRGRAREDLSRTGSCRGTPVHRLARHRGG